MKELINDFAKWLDKKSAPQPKIEFYSAVEGIEKWSPILPASKAIPDWYRKLPKNFTVERPSSYSLDGDAVEFARDLPSGTPPEWGINNQTVKTCPGLQDIMTTGFVCTFWGSAIIEVSRDGKGVASITSSQNAAYDTETSKTGINGNYISLKELHDDEFLYYLKGRGFTDEEIGNWTKVSSNPDLISFSSHPEGQYKTLLDEMPERYSQTLIKLHNPWRIKTPKGYSTMITNPVYHMHPIIETLPGIIDTDYYHMFNNFFMLKEKGVKFELPFGTPTAHYYVVKRTDFPYELRSANHDDLLHERELQNVMNSHWGSSRPYRMMKKIFNKDKGGKCPFSS